MVARGDVEENRHKADEHGFEFPVVLQERWNLSKEYGIFAVPVAFLIDEDGVIAKGVARGVDEILALIPQGVAAGKDLKDEEGRAMNEDSLFDEISRVLASPMPRRRAFRLVFGGLAVAAATVAGPVGRRPREVQVGRRLRQGGVLLQQEGLLQIGQVCCGSGANSICCPAGGSCCGNGANTICCGAGEVCSGNGSKVVCKAASPN